ncbi:ABC-2 family transporter protein [Austwickia chelonae]|uniref:ABC transporter permease protein n=1 Tax=Austwickia chelonae NBRC 105200 TaxID=1184607 RepID=K6V9A7_9MICO|nr:ABC transporter permease [Austwickia chelonae]GAB78823.1 hypothetical protein AUCHE_17_00350 [Austwickia chelonae NBRC 105200]SEV84853.1 ABC-2 family transporter protein [Austwickia chelonae]
MSVALEVRKLHHKRVLWLVIGMAAFEGLWIVFTMIGRSKLTYALAQSVDMFVMLMGLVAGLIAVQIVDVDRQDRMGQWLSARGQSPLRRFMDKIMLTDAIVVAYHLALIGLVLAVAGPLGLESSQLAARSARLIVLVTICGCLAVTPLQLALAQNLGHPSTSVVTGVIAGSVSMALPYINAAWVGWLAPWGLLAAANPIIPLTMENRANPEIQLIDQAGPALAGAAAMAIIWTLVAIALVARKEQQR